MQFTAAQLASLIGATIEGDAEVSVHAFGKIEEAQPGQLSFLANPKYEEHLYTTNASLVILNKDFVLRQPVAATLLRVNDAYSSFATLLDIYQKMQQSNLTGIQQPSYVASSATIGEDVFIGAFAYISQEVTIGKNSKIYPHCFIGNNVTIGENCVLHAGVKIYHQCQLGSNVIIHAGTVIGSDGFGFAPKADGSLQKVPQIGHVIIEDNVEIGANTTIDRATIGATIVRKGAKLDNLIQIAHNVEVGDSTVIAAQAGISGSTKIGKGVMIGGQAGIVGHIQVGDAAKVNAQSGVTKSIEKGKAVTGTPAADYTQSLRSQALVRQLPELEKRIKELENIIKSLKSEK
ncbi:MAG: UDP-3-O-(3-hydroxymyristoyl)glucosamine N-acyltransferase [Chitinophagia bacterium]|nr:UDP-3-O-(3-hydroxymyristoyl)glucosamine N-acyltransferase [Chitinophagia bacterium]